MLKSLMKYREFRIAINYFLGLIIFGWSSNTIVNTIHDNKVTSFQYIKLFFASIFIIYAFECLYYFIYHIFHIRKYKEVMKQKSIINWNFENNVWQNFIKHNIKNELKVKKKLLIRVLAPMFGVGVILLLAVNKFNLHNIAKDGNEIILLIIFFPLIKIILDGMGILYYYLEGRFCNHEIIGFKNAIIICGAIHYWDEESNYKLDEIEIFEEKYIHIRYSVTRYKLINRVLDEIFTIPIPEDKIEEAVKYVEKVKKYNEIEIIKPEEPIDEQ